MPDRSLNFRGDPAYDVDLLDVDLGEAWQVNATNFPYQLSYQLDGVKRVQYCPDASAARILTCRSFDKSSGEMNSLLFNEVT